MDSGLCQKRVDVSGDRLSCLQDDLIHKILSSFDITHVIETSVLSSRWRYIWTTMPYLNFSSHLFPSLLDYSKFVTHVLSRRNNETEVSAVKLDFRGKASQAFVKRILKYAFSHNVKQMTVTQLHQEGINLPLCPFSSHSLEDLALIDFTINHSIMPSSTWELPALTTLLLDHVALYDDASDNFSCLFSICTNLKNLILKECRIVEGDGLRICHPQLSNLVLENTTINAPMGSASVVKVDAPQLKILCLRFGVYSLQFISDNLPCLEKVDLCIDNIYPGGAHQIVGLLRQFHGVKFLTLNLEIMEAISSSVELISNQPSPFSNLKSLKVYPSLLDLAGKVNVSTDQVKHYLLDSSPSATFTMVSYQEMRDARNAKRAQEQMAEVRVLLDQEKRENYKAHMDMQKAQKKSLKAKMHEKGKAQVENKGEQAGMDLPLIPIGAKKVSIQSCLEELKKQTEHLRARAESIFSKLQDIEELLTKLPASKRVKMEPCFYSLCAEATTQSRLSVYFDELAKRHNNFLSIT